MLLYSLSFNGFLASICYLFQWFISFIGSWGTDLIRYKKIMSTIHIRKGNTVIGLWAGCNADLALALFARASGLNNMSVCGLACPLKFKVLGWSLAILPGLCLGIRSHQKKFQNFRSTNEAWPAFLNFRPFIKGNRPYFGLNYRVGHILASDHLYKFSFHGMC